jgi:polar amino acid transport system substrate-binding protein
MRKSLIVLSGALVTVPMLTLASGTTGISGAATTTAAAKCVTAHSAALTTKGALTIATDNPVYEPWFKDNTPTSGKGYESAVAYALAADLGFSSKAVKWTYEPFDNSYQPGKKSFDFDINEISVTPERSKVVTFSSSYYDVTQSLLTLKGNPIVTKHSPAQLKSYTYGDQIGTTGLAYINNFIKPTTTTKVYNDLASAEQALAAHQIDAIVLDTPDAQYEASSNLPNGVQVGQFPSTGEHYGLLFTKNNPLVACVNQAIGDLTANKTLAHLQTQWLSIYTSVPSIKP